MALYYLNRCKTVSQGFYLIVCVEFVWINQFLWECCKREGCVEVVSACYVIQVSGIQ